MRNRVFFGNGVYVSDDGVVHVESRLRAGMGVQVAKFLKESLEEAIAYAERIAGGTPLGLAPAGRKQLPN